MVNSTKFLYWQEFVVLKASWWFPIWYENLRGGIWYLRKTGGNTFWRLHFTFIQKMQLRMTEHWWLSYAWHTTYSVNLTVQISWLLPTAPRLRRKSCWWSLLTCSVMLTSRWEPWTLFSLWRRMRFRYSNTGHYRLSVHFPYRPNRHNIFSFGWQ